MLETIVFFSFIIGVGYLMFWTVVNEMRDANGGHEGWFAIRRPKEEKKPANNSRQKPWLRN